MVRQDSLGTLVQNQLVGIVCESRKNRREKLGWVPTTTVEELCREMVESDLRLMRMGELESFLVLRAQPR